MDEKELQEMGMRINVAMALAGKKENLSDQIKEQNAVISGNNAKVAELQKEMDADNADAAEVISSLEKELGEVTKGLTASLASLEKAGYKLPIGGKTSKTVSL